MTPEQLFSDLLAAAPSRPFVTYYDEATGERTELSVKSLGNWVAKTHHLLATELGLGVGDTAVLALPAHWISIPALLGCLTAGLTLSPADPAADVAFVAPDTMSAAAGVPEVFAIGPERAAAGFGTDAPQGALDYVTAIRPQADTWGSVTLAASGADPFWGALTRAAAVAEARERAARFGLAAGARVLTTRDWGGPEDWLDTLLAPLAVGGSVVYVRNCADPAVLARRGEQERCTDTV